MKKLLCLFLLVYVLNLSVAFTQQTNKPAKWEKAIAAYEKVDSTNPPPKGG
jgi:hypothetical protein